MSNDTILTVVIPALNEEKVISYLLKDLDEQTDKRFGVIIVDGKSEDKTKEKAKEFAKKLPLRIIEVEKRNVSYQRNVGADNAKTPYIFFLDADTRIDPDCIKKLIDHIINDKELLLLPYIVPSGKSLSERIVFALAVRGVVIANRVNTPLAFGPSIVIEKNLFEKIGKFDENAYVSEDHNIVVKARKVGIKAALLKDVKTVYSTRRFRNEGMFKAVGKYIIFILITIFKGAVYKSPVTYDMSEKRHENTQK